MCHFCWVNYLTKLLEIGIIFYYSYPLICNIHYPQVFSLVWKLVSLSQVTAYCWTWFSHIDFHNFFVAVSARNFSSTILNTVICQADTHTQTITICYLYVQILWPIHTDVIKAINNIFQWNSCHHQESNHGHNTKLSAHG